MYADDCELRVQQYRKSQLFRRLRVYIKRALARQRYIIQMEDQVGMRGLIVTALPFKNRVAEIDCKRVKKKLTKIGVKSSSIRSVHIAEATKCILYIRNFFSQEDVSFFVLYFTGHGTKRGNWHFRDGSFITLKQILLHCWSRSDQPKNKNLKLLIISDSCYSGSWVKALDRYHQRKEYLGVEMVAACRSHEQTWMSNGKGSYFTKAICQKYCHYNKVPKCTHSLSSFLKKIWLP